VHFVARQFRHPGYARASRLEQVFHCHRLNMSVPDMGGLRAFITYSHRNRRVAEWLHKAIENYRVPASLVGAAGRDGAIPRHVFPVFRDRDELGSAPDLSELIREALAQSAYLIVLCSPSAAKSR
jgi:MTH538 TIR-like domain (DUF1863)